MFFIKKALLKFDRSENFRHLAVNACMLPVCYAYGMAITTVEGVGQTRSKVDEIQVKISGKNFWKIEFSQRKLTENHGVQCGYCSPGFVMSMYALLRSKSAPSQRDIELAIQGNLCRCTGYRPILEAFYDFADPKKVGVSVVFSWELR